MPPLLFAVWTTLSTWLTALDEPEPSAALTWEEQVDENFDKVFMASAPVDAHFEYKPWNLKIIPEQNRLQLGINLLDASEESLVTEADLEPRKDQVERLLTEGVVLTVDGEDWNLAAQSKDLVFTKVDGALQMNFSDEFMSYLVSSAQSLIDREASDITLLKVADGQETNQSDGKAFKVDLEGTILEGRALDPLLLKVALIKMLQEGQTAQEVPLTRTPGQIINDTGLELGPLEEIGVGKSTFWGSSPEREFNIEKALNEKFNGIVVPAGAEFSYVEFLGPIEYGGWKQAYTIFQGTKLEKAPAGGVCQISTTVYRAVLDAALPLTEQRAHSLYVIYYNDYGDGLDATVYPGEQDLKFVNNTQDDILLIAQEEGYYEAVVRIFGHDDGRETTLIGPYTASNQSEETRTELGNLGIGDMAWKYIVTSGDGTTETQWIHNSYMSIATQHREVPTELDTSIHPPHP